MKKYRIEFLFFIGYLLLTLFYLLEIEFIESEEVFPGNWLIPRDAGIDFVITNHEVLKGIYLNLLSILMILFVIIVLFKHVARFILDFKLGMVHFLVSIISLIAIQLFNNEGFNLGQTVKPSFIMSDRNFMQIEKETMLNELGYHPLNHIIFIAAIIFLITQMVLVKNIFRGYQLKSK